MLDSIKHYEISETACLESLVDLDFYVVYDRDRNYSFKANKTVALVNDIYLTITIYRNEYRIITFNEDKDINVWDYVVGVNYFPFYHATTHFALLDNVIDEYHKYMDSLCELGILKEKNMDRARKRSLR